MQYSKLLANVEEEIARMFHKAKHLPLLYHNLQHTKSVVAHAKEIADHYQLNEEDRFIVLAAAWFHDTGYLADPSVEHEISSAAFARKYFEAKETNAPVIDKIIHCIHATRIPQQPSGILEEIVCDADLFHFGLPAFVGLNKLMRKEQQVRLDKKIDKRNWAASTLSMLQEHHFKTSYAKELLSAGKQKNISLLRDKLAAWDNDKAAITGSSPANGTVQEESIMESTISKRPARGIETMFRISSNNHQRLSDMADNKANIMITTTSIILSILLSVLLRKLEDNPHLIFPSFLLLTVCLVTMIFSIKATRPKLPGGRFTKQELDEKKTNLLFFGNFYKMSYQEYHEGMEAMMNDRNFLYGSLTLDVYSQGIVLGKKYRLLRLAYNTFMYGVSAAVIAFFSAVLLAMY